MPRYSVCEATEEERNYVEACERLDAADHEGASMEDMDLLREELSQAKDRVTSTGGVLYDHKTGKPVRRHERRQPD